MPVVNAGWTLGLLMRVVKPFLRPKLRDRIVICKSEELFATHKYETANLPSCVGGTREPDPELYERFLHEKLERRKTSVAAVRI